MRCSKEKERDFIININLLILLNLEKTAGAEEFPI
jgi:hypothetical protein